MNREAIYAALFAKGKAAAGFSQSARRLRHIADLQPSEFPAFYQVQKDEGWKQPSGNLPPVGELTVEWWVYVFGADDTASHAAQLNPLIDALTASLGLPPAANPTGYQSLGGLALAVRLDGRIDYAEGAMDDRGFARIPLVITLPG
jgi:hypothetical protein